MTNLERQLFRHESMVLKPYKDTVGKLTIGVGRNLDDMGISEDEALFMLRNDIRRCQYELVANILYWDSIDEVRQDVLLNMCFNLGISRLRSFRKMWNAIKDKDYETASVEMLDSRWSQQVGNRAKELANIMKTGI